MTFPMSYEQESIWLNDQLHDGASRYVESWVHRLRGDISVHAIEQALSGIVRRHEALRSRLIMADSGPSQIVVPPMPVRVDRRTVLPEQLQPALREAACRPVRLDDPPLLRATLLELASDDMILVLAIHHAVIDGWCFRLLDIEFSALYRDSVQGKEPSLPQIPVQFGAYATQQRQRPAEEVAELINYWRSALEGAPAESTFPTDWPRPHALSRRGERIEFSIDGSLKSGIRKLAQELRTTPFSVLATAITALLGLLSRQQDIVIGTPISRRDQSELEPMIACLTDVMPVRGHVLPDASFSDLVLATKSAVWGAVAHRDVSFGQLVRELGVDRTLARFPLFQVVFTVDDGDAPGLSLPGVVSERMFVHSDTAKYDVFVELLPEYDGYRGLFEFSTDLFSYAGAERLVQRFVTLLADAVRHPERPLGQLAILPAEERHLVLETWANGPVPPRETPTVHEAFRRQAFLLPDQYAVVHADRTLTYRELDKASDHLAALLLDREHGGKRVAITVERSVNLPVVLLGVLKAGCCCVPVDLAYPASRATLMMEDCDAALLLTQRSLTNHLTPPERLDVLFVDDFMDDLLSGDVAPNGMPSPTVMVDDSALAYVVYTSGSTGRPKGVAMPHRALANLVDWQSRRFGCGAGSRTLQFAPVSFDVSFQECFSTWAAGGTLVLIDEQTRKDPEALLDVVEQQSVQRLFLPFVALQQLADVACASARTCRLREIITSGEQLYITPSLRTFFAELTHASLENQYGPSETHVVTAERLSSDPSAWPHRPPIGRPVDGVCVRILDADLDPVPVGVVGEICIGGRALADGYLGQPDLTHEKFVRDPHSGERLYRSGDLGRFLFDGVIEILGRRDSQTKIRGHRVELAGVESAICAVPGVADAVVLATDSPHAPSKRLVAYYLTDTGLTPTRLRATLHERIPYYLVPAACIRLDRFPLTASGKVDRAALTSLPVDVQDTVRASYTPPRSRSEQLVAKVWQRLLGVERVSADDNFFAIGGDSLLSTQVVLALRAEVDVEIPLNSVFTAPTVAELAAQLDDCGAAAPVLGPTKVVQLPADIVRVNDPPAAGASPQQVLLTGATGFLGAFLLRSLLTQTNATVHCLVRGHDDTEAHSRLLDHLQAYGLWQDNLRPRVHVVRGNLARPRLGLEPDAYNRLSHAVDAIYHCGASVNLAHTYRELRATNVDGTVEVLRLAAASRTKFMHYISTVGVLSGEPPKGGRYLPDDPLPPLQGLHNGYAQSKWMAECVIEQARQRGLPICIYRPTRIAAATDSGVCHETDFLWLLLKTCVETGLAPANSGIAFDLVPVNYVSDAVVSLSLNPQAEGRTFHLAAGRLLHLSTAVDWLRVIGYSIRDLPADEWMRRMETSAADTALPLLSIMITDSGGFASEGSARFATDATDELLSGSGVTLPENDAELFAASVHYFMKTKYLPPTQG
ncbi:amino acid adenylation domain-containing protein [Streptomyces sp. 1222.5]|uniref:non-ribosomal peptide synthetase family protein n=1 Tax=Streptomyces sp. 1222.5 TaxID=1881026 RepID=UPI003EB90EE7